MNNRRVPFFFDYIPFKRIAGHDRIHLIAGIRWHWHHRHLWRFPRLLSIRIDLLRRHSDLIVIVVRLHLHARHLG